METLDIKNDMPNNMEIEKKQKNFSLSVNIYTNKVCKILRKVELCQ